MFKIFFKKIEHYVYLASPLDSEEPLQYIRSLTVFKTLISIVMLTTVAVRTLAEVAGTLSDMLPREFYTHNSFPKMERAELCYLLLLSSHPNDLHKTSFPCCLSTDF